MRGWITCWVEVVTDGHRYAVLNSTGADYIFIPEQPPKGDKWEDEMCEVLKAVSRGVVPWNGSYTVTNSRHLAYSTDSLERESPSSLSPRVRWTRI